MRAAVRGRRARVDRPQGMRFDARVSTSIAPRPSSPGLVPAPPRVPFGHRVFRGFAAMLSRLSDARIARLADVFFTGTKRRYQRAAADPAGAQWARLSAVLTANAHTAFGKAHGFAALTSVDAFRAEVPLSTWEDTAADVDAMLAGDATRRISEPAVFYATTSGTTGRRKLIPVTGAFVHEFRTGRRVWLRTLLTRMPGIVRGKMLTMHSPSVEELPGGAQAGSITVALSGGLDDADGVFDAVPRAVFRVKDFETRYKLCLRFALCENVSVVAAINPSTVLLFAQTFEAHHAALADAIEAGTLGVDADALDPAIRAQLEARARPNPAAAAAIRESAARHGGTPRLTELWPNLAGLCCWQGGTAPWYVRQLRTHFGALPMLDYGYAASEGCFGVPLDVNTAASVLVPHGHFMEFMPVETLDACRRGDVPTTLLHELEEGRQYVLVITTSSGLYRYDMNDVIEVVGFDGNAPMAVFKHKAGLMSSVTGEKLGESHVVAAMDHALEATGLDTGGFIAAPVWPTADAPSTDAVVTGDGMAAAAALPHYVLAVEAALSDADRAALTAAFEAGMCAANEEYEAKTRSLRLGPARVVSMPAGAVKAHRARRVADGAPDAHVKVPHLDPQGTLFAALGAPVPAGFRLAKDGS